MQLNNLFKKAIECEYGIQIFNLKGFFNGNRFLVISFDNSQFRLDKKNGSHKLINDINKIKRG